MNTLKKISYASIATALLTPAISLADQAPGADTLNGHSMVHRISHSLASNTSYTASGTAGYKWGRESGQVSPREQWVEAESPRPGYKWGDANKANPTTQSVVSNSFQWGTMNFSEQSGYRWGMKNFGEQTGYRWGMKGNSEQSGYRWGMKGYSEQSGYRWGMKSYATNVF